MKRKLKSFLVWIPKKMLEEKLDLERTYNILDAIRLNFGYLKYGVKVFEHGELIRVKVTIEEVK